MADAGVCAAFPLEELLLGLSSVGFNYFLFFLPVMLPYVLPKLATDSAARMFPGVWNPLFFRVSSQDRIPFPGWSSLPTSFVSLFIFYIFSLPVFEDNGLLFWLPDVLCQHSEVVLWSLLSVEMFF